MAMHQVHFKAEVRTIKELGVEAAPVSDAELKLANQLIEQLAAKRFDPNEYVDEHRTQGGGCDPAQGGRQGSVLCEAPLTTGGTNVVDLMEVLKASLNARGNKARKGRKAPKKASVPGEAASPENPDDEMQEYSLADLKRLFGLPPALIRKLSEAGFITTRARGARKEQIHFQDLLVLRVAGALKAAKISTPKIVEALEQIRTALPTGRLPAIALAASGKDLAVREWRP